MAFPDKSYDDIHSGFPVAGWMGYSGHTTDKLQDLMWRYNHRVLTRFATGFNLSFTNSTKKLLFVPSGFTAIVTMILFRWVSGTISSSANFRIGIGASPNNWHNGFKLNTLNAANKAAYIFPIPFGTGLAPGDIPEVDGDHVINNYLEIENNATGTTGMMNAICIGNIFKNPRI